MERGREEQGLMEEGECGGGLMEGRECWGWGISLCVCGKPPHPLASHDGVPLLSRVDSSSRVASSSHVASLMCVAFSSCVTSLRMLPVFMCRCDCMLSSGAVSGWWCWALVVVHGVACSPFPSIHMMYMAWALISFAIRCAPSSWGCKQG